MVYFVAEDEFYYSDQGTREILSKYPNIDNVIKWPDAEEIKKTVKGELAGTAFLAPYRPSRINGIDFSENLFFEEVELPNKFGILTTGQKRLGLSNAEILEKRLGVDFIESTLTMANYGGATKLHEQVEIIRQKFRHKEATKGFLLTGVPGTGKSFFAKCLAGELGYLLVALNLSTFMEKSDTVQAINDFFKFFKHTPGKYIIWIDEIEKMFTGEKSQQVIGALLTNINEASNISDDTSFFIVATANNVSGITKTNPEFFRNGRFDAVIFLMPPTEEDAIKIFKTYIKQQRKRLVTSLIPMAIKNWLIDKKDVASTRSEEMARELCGHLTETQKEKIISMKDSVSIAFITKDIVLFNRIEAEISRNTFNFDEFVFMRAAIQEYSSSNALVNRFVYTPAEIEFIVQDTFHAYYLLEKEDFAYGKMIKRYHPLQESIKDGVREIIAKASNFMEI